MRVRPYLSFAGLLMVTATLLAAQAPSAVVTINGTVIDDAKAPLASAEIGLSLDGRAPASARSDKDGHFEFVGVLLAPGSITVRRLGYRAQRLTLDLKKVKAGE